MGTVQPQTPVSRKPITRYISTEEISPLSQFVGTFIGIWFSCLADSYSDLAKSWEVAKPKAAPGIRILNSVSAL